MRSTQPTEDMRILILLVFPCSRHPPHESPRPTTNTFSSLTLSASSSSQKSPPEKDLYPEAVNFIAKQARPVRIPSKEDLAETRKMKAHANTRTANPAAVPIFPSNFIQKPKPSTFSVPKFDGALQNWLHFRDWFLQSVD
ncbi:unnamed protein product [Allacma fusca]|uniref:Uncharacterized protein n=1 Tax=Allacma fusca TaxID=39272 RepID=A0A8J2K464_9HEXA|nr:unnamed protein product [Allacma fusca]